MIMNARKCNTQSPGDRSDFFFPHNSIPSAHFAKTFCKRTFPGSASAFKKSSQKVAGAFFAWIASSSIKLSIAKRLALKEIDRHQPINKGDSTGQNALITLYWNVACRMAIHKTWALKNDVDFP